MCVCCRCSGHGRVSRSAVDAGKDAVERCDPCDPGRFWHRQNSWADSSGVRGRFILGGAFGKDKENMAENSRKTRTFDEYFKPGIVCIYAAPGHGKTVSLRRFIAAGRSGKAFLRVDVIDPLFVLRQVYPGSGKLVFHESLESYWKIYCEGIRAGSRGPSLVIADEIGFLLAESAGAKSQGKRLFKTCRNFGVTLITTDQRTADTPRDLTACARIRMWGRLKEPLDLDYAKEYGVDPRRLVNLERHHFLIQSCY